MAECTPIFEGENGDLDYNVSYDIHFSLSPNHSLDYSQRNTNETEPFFYTNITYIPPSHTFYEVEQFLRTKIILIIVVFGIIGNLLNLIILTRKSLSTHMDRMEKSAHIGLVALASSDLLFCVSAFPHCIQDLGIFEYRSLNFWLVYDIYGHAVINIFIMSSTWLTVSMALSRYVAICYPLRGRQLLGITFGWLSIVIVFIFCVVFNLPRFWMQQIDYIECLEGGYSYYSISGPVRQNASVEKAYMWLYFIFCIFIPLAVLTYCNVYLIRALRMSAKMRKQHTRSRDTSTDSKNIVTLTLTVIVICYIVLVVPAEILNFAKYNILETGFSNVPLGYNLAVTFCNTLQAINFALNFILYCIINVHFRRTVKEFFGCKHTRRRFRSWSTMRYESVTGTTGVFTENTHVHASTKL